MNILRVIARPLLAAPFIVDGISALRSPDEHVERAQAVLPVIDAVAPGRMPTDDDLRVVTRILGGVTTAAGVCFAIGRVPRPAAAVLGAIALPMAIVNTPIESGQSRHERKEALSGLVTRLGLVGGLAIASADRVGRPSAAWRWANWNEQRERIAEVRATERARALARIEAAS